MASDIRVGLILATNSSRPEWDFVVIRRVTGYEYPALNVAELIRDFEKATNFDGTRSYPKVWFQPTEIPK